MSRPDCCMEQRLRRPGICRSPSFFPGSLGAPLLDHVLRLSVRGGAEPGAPPRLLNVVVGTALVPTDVRVVLSMP